VNLKQNTKPQSTMMMMMMMIMMMSCHLLKNKKKNIFLFSSFFSFSICVVVSASRVFCILPYPFRLTAAHMVPYKNDFFCSRLSLFSLFHFILASFLDSIQYYPVPPAPDFDVSLLVFSFFVCDE
jgi:hypothetical protein